MTSQASMRARNFGRGSERSKNVEINFLPDFQKDQIFFRASKLVISCMRSFFEGDHLLRAGRRPNSNPNLFLTLTQPPFYPKSNLFLTLALTLICALTSCAFLRLQFYCGIYLLVTKGVCGPGQTGYQPNCKGKYSCNILSTILRTLTAFPCPRAFEKASLFNVRGLGNAGKVRSRLFERSY